VCFKVLPEWKLDFWVGCAVQAVRYPAAGVGGLRGGKAGIFRKIRVTPPDGHLVFEEAGRVGFLGNRL
jgi:hypothetical protein